MSSRRPIDPLVTAIWAGIIIAYLLAGGLILRACV